MLTYKLLEEYFCHYKNLVNGDFKVQIVKRIFLLLLKFNKNNFIFLFIKDIGSKTYLGRPKKATSHIW